MANDNGLASRISAITGQLPVGVELVAVSKTRTADEIRAAYNLGLRDFGENYLQDARPKMQALSDLADIRWHFIGQIQSKKLKDIVGAFDLIQSLGDVKHAQAISRLALEKGIQQPVLIQTNFAAESTKTGFLRDNFKQALEQLTLLKGLEMRGVMDMPPIFSSPSQSTEFYQRYVEDIHNTAREFDWNVKVMSLGTSQDFLSAVKAGSNMVRIGTQIFGPRETKGAGQ